MCGGDPCTNAQQFINDMYYRSFIRKHDNTRQGMINNSMYFAKQRRQIQFSQRKHCHARHALYLKCEHTVEGWMAGYFTDKPLFELKAFVFMK